MNHSATAMDFFRALQKADLKKGSYFTLFCLFWVFVASLELGQDLIDAHLNNRSFYISESAAYKMFWLLFIPCTIMLVIAANKVDAFFKGKAAFISHSVIVMGSSLIHLLIFSLLLLGVSWMIHTNPWPLNDLISEKLSTRLYIVLAVYMVSIGAFFWFRNRESSSGENEDETISTITVKNGVSSVLVPVDSIKWIQSEGNYLFIHTTNKKHITSDSLKNIITLLPGNFRRIHRSTIVNIELISKLKSRLNGDYDVHMNDGSILRLSRNYAKPLKGILLG